MNIAIIGAGLAGCHTAMALRQAEEAADLAPSKITVFNGESHPPYDRPPLSKELLSRPKPVPLQEASGANLSASDVDLRTGTTITGLTQSTHGWQLASSHGEFTADHVIVATGLVPRSPWPQAQVLKTLDDAASLRAALAADAGPVVIIGAGWIGAELAWQLHHHGREVIVVEAGPHPLWQQLGQVGSLTASWYEAAGITLLTDTKVLAVTATSDDSPFQVSTSVAQIPAGVVVSAVGGRPATDFLTAHADLLTPTGHLRVNSSYQVCSGEPPVAGLWAVGDVAQAPGRIGGHWFDAIRDPNTLAHGLYGLPLPAPALQEVFSEQFGRRIVGLGQYTPDPRAVLSVEKTTDQDGVITSFVAHYRDDAGTLLGAVICEAPREVIAVRKELRRALRNR